MIERVLKRWRYARAYGGSRRAALRALLGLRRRQPPLSLEAAARVWLQGCSNAPPGFPELCEECTAVYRRHIQNLIGCPRCGSRWHPDCSDPTRKGDLHEVRHL